MLHLEYQFGRVWLSSLNIHYFLAHLTDKLVEKYVGFSLYFSTDTLSPLPSMPILDSSNSETNKDMMSKIWTNGDTVI